MPHYSSAAIFARHRRDLVGDLAFLLDQRWTTNDEESKKQQEEEKQSGTISSHRRRRSFTPTGVMLKNKRHRRRKSKSTWGDVHANFTESRREESALRFPTSRNSIQRRSSTNSDLESVTSATQQESPYLSSREFLSPTSSEFHDEDEERKFWTNTTRSQTETATTSQDVLSPTTKNRSNLSPDVSSTLRRYQTDSSLHYSNNLSLAALRGRRSSEEAAKKTEEGNAEEENTTQGITHQANELGRDLGIPVHEIDSQLRKKQPVLSIVKRGVIFLFAIVLLLPIKLQEFAIDEALPISFAFLVLADIGIDLDDEWMEIMVQGVILLVLFSLLVSIAFLFRWNVVRNLKKVKEDHHTTSRAK